MLKKTIAALVLVASMTGVSVAAKADMMHARMHERMMMHRHHMMMHRHHVMMHHERMMHHGM